LREAVESLGEVAMNLLSYGHNRRSAPISRSSHGRFRKCLLGAWRL
jgi:hypothetical protein